MKHSHFLRIVKVDGHDELLCYNSLYGAGNLQLLYEKKYFDCLLSFSNDRVLTKSDNKNVVTDLIDARFLVESNTSKNEERKEYDESILDWCQAIIGGKRISYLNLSVSELCNFACSHCSRARGKELLSAHNKVDKLMEWELAKKSIDYFWNSFCEPNNIDIDTHFGSDEPLLNWPVIKKSVEYIRKLNPSANLSVNSNLSKLSKDMALFFKENDVDVITSLDGLVEGNDKIRTLKNGHGTFNAIFKSIELLKSIDYPVRGFISTILDANWDNINYQFIDWAASQEFDSIAIDVDLVNNMYHSNEECVNKLISLYDYILEKGLKCGGTWLNPFETLLNGSLDGMPAYCKCIKGCGISINPKGDIYTCSGSTTKLGNISNVSKLFDIGSKYHNLISRKITTVNTQCDGCPIESVCKNQCFMTSEYSEATKNSRKQEMCYIYKEATEKLLQRKLVQDLAN